MRSTTIARTAALAVLLAGAGCVNVDGGSVGYFQGRLVDAATRRPVGGVRVAVGVGGPTTPARTTTGAVATTAADGTFSVAVSTPMSRDGRDRSSAVPPPTVYVSIVGPDGTPVRTVEVSTAGRPTTDGDTELGTIDVNQP